MKIMRLMLLFLVIISITSPVALAINLDTHLDSISPITVQKGATIKTTAQLWSENVFDGLWDNPVSHQDLYFSLYSEGEKELVFQNQAQTGWPTGKATLKINTKDIIPGRYILSVEFRGGSELRIGKFRPSSTNTTVIITPNISQ